jgi:ubiquinone/menaquinone biosynthesis C-methylase UbiE
MEETLVNQSGEAGGRAVFQAGERGDRTRPASHDRLYWHLRLLLDKMRRVAASDLLAPGDQLLDYGCGNKPYRELFAGKFKRHVGVDIEGNPEAELVLGPEGQIPAAADSFDCVLSSQVLEHVPDPAGYLKESFRVLRPGGSLVLSTHGVWQYHPDPTDFWRWTHDGLLLQIRRAGFEISQVESVGGPESAALQRWQDATFERLPRAVRPAYTWLIQRCIGFIERRRGENVTPDAEVYVVLARKPEARGEVKR